MDSEGPDTLTGKDIGGQSIEESVTAGAAARVGAILSRAEARGQAIAELAERDATTAEDAARAEGQRIADNARAAAQAAARRRVHEISELRSSIAARAGSLVDGLEGAELTRARLEELVAALGQAADALLVEAGLEPGDDVHFTPAPRDESGSNEDDEAPAAEVAKPSDEDALAAAYEGTLPEGAPMVRRPQRVREARFAAVLMAVQGQERQDVEQRLASEYGVVDCDQLLNDVFGRADATA